jgi:hypothetical protein
MSTAPPPTDEWRPVPGYEDLYEVSRAAAVRRLAPGANRPAGAPLHGSVDDSGRRLLELYRDGRGRRLYRDWVVATAFLGPRNGTWVVAHRDGDRGHDAVGNLRWKPAPPGVLPPDLRDRLVTLAGAGRDAVAIARALAIPRATAAFHLARLTPPDPPGDHPGGTWPTTAATSAPPPAVARTLTASWPIRLLMLLLEGRPTLGEAARAVGVPLGAVAVALRDFREVGLELELDRPSDLAGSHCRIANLRRLATTGSPT